MSESQLAWVQRVLRIDVLTETDLENEEHDPEWIAPDDVLGIRFDKTKTKKSKKKASGSSSKKTEEPTAPVVDPDKTKCDTAGTDFFSRYNALKTSYEMASERSAFIDAYTEFGNLRTADDHAQAAGKIADVDGKLKALEALTVGLPEKERAATAEAKRIKSLKDSDIAKLSASDKAAIVKKLLAGGLPTGEVREAQIKVYQATSLNKGFMKADTLRGKAIAKDLKSDKSLKTARKGWKKASDDDKIALMKKIVAVQSKHLGIPAPEIVMETTPPKDGLITNGYFSAADGKLHINMHPKSSVQNFQRAIDLAIHENAHNWQASLVKRLQDGTLKPGDVDYEQALMFEVNNLHPGGYINGQESFSAYKKQPVEDHSHTTGPSTAKKIMKVI